MKVVWTVWSLRPCEETPTASFSGHCAITRRQFDQDRGLIQLFPGHDQLGSAHDGKFAGDAFSLIWTGIGCESC